jgi:hypothetical protein
MSERSQESALERRLPKIGIEGDKGLEAARSRPAARKKET